MKNILLILILTCAFKLYSQEIIVLEKDKFEFHLLKDCDENKCKISEIKVFKDGVLIQNILPSENSFYAFIKKESIIEIEDMNFDTHIDFRILHSFPADYPFPYLYWMYNDKTKLFEKNTDYEIIISPKFDSKKKRITSSWREYVGTIYKDVYTVKNGAPTLAERYITNYTFGKNRIEIWKTVNGKLTLIDKKEE